MSWLPMECTHSLGIRATLDSSGGRLGRSFWWGTKSAWLGILLRFGISFTPGQGVSPQYLSSSGSGFPLESGFVKGVQANHYNSGGEDPRQILRHTV